MTADRILCLWCGADRDLPGILCSACTADGHRRARASQRRQIAAGMPVPHRNWRDGDSHWWLASGVYGSAAASGAPR